MREDMAKIIVERPRPGGGNKTPKGSVRLWQRYPMDEWRSYEGMRRQWRGRRKGLNENLKPLERFLRSALGRPWDEVHSEIRQRINLNSAVQLHIWQHVEQFVTVHVFERDGVLVDRRGNPIRYFYVDANGVLREIRRETRKNPKRVKRAEYIWNGADSQFRVFNGIWYLLKLKPVPCNYRAVRDVVFHTTLEHIIPAQRRKYYGSDVYAYAKEQLNTREVEELLNEHPEWRTSVP